MLMVHVLAISSAGSQPQQLQLMLFIVVDHQIV
jgi:hypothetical protein